MAQPDSIKQNPFLDPKLEATVLDSNGKVDPKKVQAIETAMTAHQANDGEVHPALKKAIALAKSIQ